MRQTLCNDQNIGGSSRNTMTASMTIPELQAAWNAQSDKHNQWDELGIDEIVAFAQQMEREACAKVCDEYAEGSRENMADVCADKIRARSNPTQEKA